MPHAVRRAAIALLIAVMIVPNVTAAVAGTTGTIQGTVVDPATSQPVAGARITAASPSQSATTTSDAAGRYTFLSLTPDTYTVSVAAGGTYDAFTVNGVTVQADQTQTVTLQPPRRLQTIGSVTSRAANALVKPGTTADVYSINATTQDKASALGGGGTLNSAWSAMASVPGVFIGPNQNGYLGAGPGISIRGGDYDQIGYELDGVPVNRSFDNYPSGTLSALGQQELQVYTGANPANSEAQGISGYINQVIRTGTRPAYNDLNLAIGGPALYHRIAFESGGATPSRSFSYYLGAGAYDQTFRYIDQSNGAGLSRTWGPPILPCDPSFTAALAPSCFSPGGTPYVNADATQAYVLGPMQLGNLHLQQVRDSVLNLHFGIPQSNGNKDDVQLLLDIDHAGNAGYFSTNDFGGPTLLNALGYGIPTYIDGHTFNNPLGTPFTPANAQALTTNYLFPLSPAGRPLFANVPFDASDTFVNDQNIFKVQYQHNFGTKAFLRLYGYTYYSDWLNNGPQSTYANYIAFDSPDYELSSHTRGVSLTFSDQVTNQHLVTLQGNYTTANSTRDNNTQMFNGFYGTNRINNRTIIGAVVNAGNPFAGYCFTSAGVAASCFNGGSLNTGAGGAQFASINQAAAGTVPALPAACPLAGSSTTACEYLTVGNGLYATYNTVVPKFAAVSLTDNWKPSDRLTINAGVRLDSFTFNRSDTSNSPARTFWYNAFNLDNCLTSAGAIVARPPGGACPAGSVPSFVSNPPATPVTYTNWQPRIGLTYTLDPRTVLRASFGRYVQAPNSAFQQYDALQADAPALLYGTYGFQAFGFTTPNHNVVPPASNNYDLSFEHQLNRDTSIKLTPFLRKTQNQIQQFYLNQQTNFVSGLNVGRQTSQGFELEVDKGDFSRNGLAGRLAFTYTNSYINYTKLSNGGSVIDNINGAVLNYNAYTSFCAANPTDARCAGGATATGVAAAPCYLGGAPAPCSAATVANPYWNAPVQPLFDSNAAYPTYDLFPAGVGSSANAFGMPYVGTLLLQYKHDRLSITPALQFIGGGKYGAPEAEAGVAPETCAPLAAGPDASRYPYGAPGGSGFDYSTCGGTYAVVTPNHMTGRFDNLGAFRQPNQLLLHTQISYQASPRVTLVGTFANIVNHCWGGSKVPWAVNGACGYTLLPGAGSGPQPIGNNYNPGDAIQPFLATPYYPNFASVPATSPAAPGLPFSMFVEARIKL